MGSAPAGCLVVITDVTARIEGEHRAALAEAELELVTNFSSDVLCMTDADRRVKWASQSVTGLLGWNADELVGTVMADLIHPQDQSIHATAASDAGFDDCLIRLRSKGGAYRWMARRAGGSWRGEVVDAFTDVDGLVRAQEQMRAQVLRLEEVLQRLPLPHVRLRPCVASVRTLEESVIEDSVVQDFVVEDVNLEGLAFLGVSRDELVGSTLGMALDGHQGPLIDWLRQAINSDQSSTLPDWPIHDRRLGMRRIEVHASRVDTGLSLTWRDVTEERRSTELLQDSERRFRLLADNASDAVTWIRDGVVQWVSGSIASMLGWVPDEWLGRRLDEFVHLEDLPEFMSVLQAGRDGSAGNLETGMRRFRIRSKDLSYHWVQSNVRPFVDVEGHRDGIAVSLRVVDTEVAFLHELDRQACTDDLTGLFNRREALRRIESMGAHSRRSGAGVAILLCDIDRFKDINDRLGHAAGDLMLRVLASRVVECVRSGDLAARVGGDEILVVLDGVHGMVDALDIAEKIRIAASMPIEIPAGQWRDSGVDQVEATVSIGVALVVESQDVEETIVLADRAMYEAKRQGANRVFCLKAEVSGMLVGSG